jgi:hypothetical protein
MMIRPVNNKIGQVKRATAICLSVYVSVYLKGYARTSSLLEDKQSEKVIHSFIKGEERTKK